MRLLRYVLVGGVATAAHYATLMALHAGLQWGAGWSSATGALVGAVVAYVGNRNLTFFDTATPHRAAIPRFAATAALGAAGNGLLVEGGVRLGGHYLVAQAVATLVMLAVTYHLNRRWTFQ